MNLLRIAAICRGCSKIYEQYNNTELILQRLLNIKEDEEIILHIEYFTAQVQLRRFQFTGFSLFPINMELVTEIASMVSIYATTMNALDHLVTVVNTVLTSSAGVSLVDLVSMLDRYRVTETHVGL
ncbi:hypothetical protein CBL_20501 [Carabus blaptoides fortunei]